MAKRSNTTNLFSHLEEHHPDSYVEIGPSTSAARPKSKQPSLTECLSRSKPYDASSKRAKDITHAVTVYLAKDMQPFYTVEREGFRQLLKVLDPKYQLPSRRHFVDVQLPRLFSEIRDKVLTELKDVQYYAGTTDLWTSVANHPYLSFTVHFIDQQWNLCSCCLDTAPLFDDHTGQNIADTIQDVLSNWGLRAESLIATTTDNGSNLSQHFTIFWNGQGSAALATI